MTDSNNHLAGRISAKPNPMLSTLEPLVGRWRVESDMVQGETEFEWFEGGFFLVQRVELSRGSHRISGVEYIGYDEETKSLRSHFMDNNGSNFTYTWELSGDALWTWFGERDSTNFFRGKFNADKSSYEGAWQWPDGQGGHGGYRAVMCRLG